MNYNFSNIKKNFTKRQIKILLSGVGLIGRKHAQLILRSEKSTLTGLVSPQSKENIEYANELNLPIYSSIKEAISIDKFDAAIIASPNEYHLPQALTCIENRIPILIEKPLATDLNSAILIYKESKRMNVPVLVGHHRNYNKNLNIAKEFIQSIDFGKLVAVQGAALLRKPEHYFSEGPWRTKSGGGPILINLIHEIGILRYLCGPISAVSVISSNLRRNFEVEDTAAIILRFQNGALGTFVLSDIAASQKSWELTTNENPVYPNSTDTSCYHFAGTNGSLDFPTMRAHFYRQDQEPSWWLQMEAKTLKGETGNNLENQLAHFEDVVLHGIKPKVPAEEGLENMRIIDAIMRSAISKCVIELDTSSSYQLKN